MFTRFDKAAIGALATGLSIAFGALFALDATAVAAFGTVLTGLLVWLVPNQP